MGKLKLPGAICADCKTPRDFSQVGGKCHWPVGRNKRCGGLIIAAVSEADWLECHSCSATGYENKEPCGQCDGSGWVFIRDMPAALKERFLKQAANGERKGDAT